MLRPRLFTLIVVATVACASNFVCAQSWDAELNDGRAISVDPSTNRAVIQSGVGAGSPLWDGVHRLQDGSVVTVRSGLMVPNEEVMSVRRGERPDVQPASVQSRACDDLVLKTCGVIGECDAQQPCDLAKQLRATQWQVVPQYAEDTDWAASQCERNLEDEQVFPTCDATLHVMKAPCRQLVGLLCGETKRCAASEACQTATQLLALEERAERDNNTDATLAPKRQCREMLSEHGLFPPCR